MRDLQISFVCGADGKYRLGLSAVFDGADDAIAFSGQLVDLCKKALAFQRSAETDKQPTDIG